MVWADNFEVGRDIERFHSGVGHGGPDGSVTVPVMAPKVCWAGAICVRIASAMAITERARKDLKGNSNTRRAADCTVKPPVMEGNL